MGLCSRCHCEPCLEVCRAQPVHPLSPLEARTSLLQRLAPAVDKARQIGVNLGLNSHRVFLVWTRWSGSVRGEGDEVEFARLELLPTPKVSGLDAVVLNPFSAGLLPEGSVRIDNVSVLYTEDTLRGWRPPSMPGVRWTEFPPDVSFFFEVFEDGRGDPLPERQKYRLGSQVWHREAKIGFTFVLERISEDARRQGMSRFAPGERGG